MAASSNPRVALIVGAGSNIGAATIKTFLAAGYRVASVSRSPPPPAEDKGGKDGNYTALQADASDPAAIPRIFDDLATARKDWAFPSVVVWNAASFTPLPEHDRLNPLAASLAGLDKDLGLLVKSPYLAAQMAVEVWRKKQHHQGDEGNLEDNKEKEKRKGTFIMTGNMQPRKILSAMPMLVTCGIGKSGSNYWVGLADALFREQGMRFFYADERAANGGPSTPPKGESHAKFFLSLTEDEETPSYATFVDGAYREFFP